MWSSQQRGHVGRLRGCLFHDLTAVDRDGLPLLLGRMRTASYWSGVIPMFSCFRFAFGIADRLVHSNLDSLVTRPV